MLADMLVCDVLCELVTLLVMPFCCLDASRDLAGPEETEVRRALTPLCQPGLRHPPPDNQ